MKKLVLIIIMFAGIFSAGAQTLKYKNIFPYVENKEYLIAYSYLLDYQRQDPEFINTYFQLGVISYKWCMEADPLLEYDRLDYFAYNTKLFFSLAKSKMLKNKSEVRKNRKYYQTVPELANIDKLNNEHVLSYLTKKIAEIDDYRKNINRIYSNFHKVVVNYNKTLDLYRDFLDGYTNLKNIYLMPVDILYPQLDSINIYFDSTVYAFNQYKEAIKTYPIKYNQTLKLQPIEVYRLDGITGSSLIADTVSLWNYSQWIEQLKHTIETDISKMREAILETSKKMNDKEQFYLTTKRYSDKYDGFNLQDKVINMIEKYDYSSMMSALLLYRDSKIDFLAFSKHQFNNRDNKDIMLRQRAKMYKILEDYYYATDSVLSVLSSRISPENTLKYRDFLRLYYKEGLEQYVLDERGFLSVYRNSYLENLKFFVFRDDLHFHFADSALSYNDVVYPLYVSNISNQNRASVWSMSRTANGFYWLAGEYSGKPYILYGSQPGVLWKKDLPKGQHSTLVKDYIGGALAFATGNQEGKTYVFNYNTEGKLLNTLELDIPVYARSAVFNDIDGSLLVVAKDTSYTKFSSSNNKLYVSLANVYSGQTKWSYSFDMEGSVVGAVSVDTVFYVFVNFVNFDLSGSERFTGKSPQSAGVLKISESGKILGFEPLFDEPVFAIDAIKLNSDVINIIGLESAIYDVYSRTFENQAKVKYYLYYK